MNSLKVRYFNSVLFYGLVATTVFSHAKIYTIFFFLMARHVCVFYQKS